jgi:hypothetical protein
MEEYIVYIISPLFAALGFVLRFIWDFYINRRKRELQEKIKQIEYRLKEFYYPIFFNLKREQIIWDKILKLHQKTVDIEQININMDENIILPSPTQEQPNNEPDAQESTETHVQLIKALDEENLKIHKNVQDLVHNKISTALPPKHLVDLLMQYDEHVTVYQILRAMEIYDRFPAEYDAPYPHNIISEVNKRIKELDTDYVKYNKKLG